MSSASLETHRPEHVIRLEVEPSSARDAIKGKLTFVFVFIFYDCTLHTIFFHRLFAAIRPITRDVLTLTLPAIDDPDLESLIHDRATSLVRLVHNSANRSGKAVVPADTTTGAAPKWSNLRVRFYEKRRKKASYSFFGRGAGTADEQVCWEAWTVAVRPLADARGGGGDSGPGARPAPRPYGAGRQRGGRYVGEDAALSEDNSDSDGNGNGEEWDSNLPMGSEEHAATAAESSLRDAMMTIIDIASKHKDHIPPIMSTDENPFPYDIVVLGESAVGASSEDEGSRRVSGMER
ncbi:MAG: hypothetical protein M1831_002025 [Alyxoria varia]|nr:MAG: hypothetical protein M1831_002025 [Alyxoria varia]